MSWIGLTYSYWRGIGELARRCQQNWPAYCLIINLFLSRLGIIKLHTNSCFTWGVWEMIIYQIDVASLQYVP